MFRAIGVKREMLCGRDMRIDSIQDSLFEYNYAFEDFQDEFDKYVSGKHFENGIIDISENEYLKMLQDGVEEKFRKLVKSAKSFAERNGIL